MEQKITEDQLLQEVNIGLDMIELNSNKHFIFLMETLKSDATIAMSEVIELPWYKFLQFRKLQNKVWRYSGLKKRIEEIIRVGLTAELELKELDALEQEIRIED